MSYENYPKLLDNVLIRSGRNILNNICMFQKEKTDKHKFKKTLISLNVRSIKLIECSACSTDPYTHRKSMGNTYNKRLW